MENLIATLGLLFFLFLVLAAAVEVILETFRGFLERFGFTWPKGKVSLEEALALAKEFAPDSKELNTKFEAVRTAAAQLSQKSQAKLTALNDVKQHLTQAGVVPEKLAGELNRIAGEVKAEIEKSERARIFILRLISAGIGCWLAWQTEFYIFDILAKDPNVGTMFPKMVGLKNDIMNVLVGGMAAAAGSSYWHDKLDKVRSLKGAAENLKKATA
jgi:hypothetical protein